MRKEEIVQYPCFRERFPPTYLNGAHFKFNVWFKNATRFAFTGENLRVSSPNHFVGEWIERHFADVLHEATREVMGQDYALTFDIEPELAKKLGKKQPDRQVDFVANNPARLARQSSPSGSGVASVAESSPTHR